MNRRLASLAFLMAVGPAVHAQDAPECARIEAPETVHVGGRTFKLLPGFSTPEMRLAYLLLDARCFDRAFQMLEAIPPTSDPSRRLVDGMARGVHDPEFFVQRANELSGVGVGFVQPMLVAARIDISRGNFEGGLDRLDRALEQQPDDLGANVTDTALGHRVIPSKRKREFLEAVFENDAVPPALRREAGQALLTGDPTHDEAVTKQLDTLPKTLTVGLFGPSK